MITDITAKSSEKTKCPYGRIVLSLENCILPLERLSLTPSSLDGLDSESETDLRILGCELIQTSAILLRLPQIAAATAQVLFQRFYYSRSFISQRMDFVAMACVVLASKIEEEYRRIEDVINVFHHIKQVRSGMIIQPLPRDQNFADQKKYVMRAERQVLKELGFCVHIKHPHKFIVTVLGILNLVNNRQLLQTAWNYANDGLRSDVYLQYQPETIACACIYLSARMHQVPLPTQPAWYLVFGATKEEIHKICHTILSLYTRKKPDAKKLAKLVGGLREQREEAKLKAKALISTDKSVTVSPNKTVQSVKESQKEKSVENGYASKSSWENNYKKRTYSSADGLSFHTSSDSQGSSLNKLPGDGFHPKRYRSSSRSYKRPRRSESVSPHRSKYYRKRTYPPGNRMSTHRKKYSNSSSLDSSSDNHKRYSHRSHSRAYKKGHESVSPSTEKHSRSSSSDTLCSDSPHYKKSQVRSRRDRSNSRSRRHKSSKSNHSLLHKEKVKHIHKRSHKHSSKDKYDDNGQHESYRHSRSSRHKHRRDRG